MEIHLSAAPGSSLPADILVSIAFQDLETGRETLLQADHVFHPASTIKLAVMAEVFNQASQGKLSLDETIAVHNVFPSIIDGSPYSLAASDDSDAPLYDCIGTEIPIRQLVERMIVRSSNLATNLLVERVTPEAVQALTRSLGIQDVVLLRGMDDTPAFQRGLNNQASARGLMRLLELLARGELVSNEASSEMLAILLRQEFNEGIPAGLPAGTQVAHKTGWIEGIYHDAAIVLPAGRAPYVLVVMTQGFSDPHQAHACVADISRQVYAQL